MAKEATNIGIPPIRNCVFALHLDTQREREHTIIGEREQVEQYLRGNKEAPLFMDVIRPFGSFVLDCSAPRQELMADVRAILSDSAGKKRSPFFGKAIASLETLYNSKNLVHRFVAMRIWQEYQSSATLAANNLQDAISDIALPLLFDLRRDIAEWQGISPRNPLQCLPGEYFAHGAEIRYAVGNKFQEYLLADTSLLPLVVYYLKSVYNQKQYIQVCTHCGKPFLSSSGGPAGLCSDRCRKAQQKINKRKHSMRVKEDPVAIHYNNSCAYWYYRMNRIKEKYGEDAEQLAWAKKAFAAFRKDAAEKKKEIQGGKLSSAEFDAWLLKERDTIDGLMEQCGL